jgi:hypothetical protein
MPRASCLVAPETKEEQGREQRILRIMEEFRLQGGSVHTELVMAKSGDRLLGGCRCVQLLLHRCVGAAPPPPAPPSPPRHLVANRPTDVTGCVTVPVAWEPTQAAWTTMMCCALCGTGWWERET